MSELEVCQGCGITYLLSKLNDVGICKKCDDPWQLGFAAAEARIIKLLEQTESPSHLWGGIAWAIALIKGEQKSQSEHLTDAIQTTVWAYEEGEQK